MKRTTLFAVTQLLLFLSCRPDRNNVERFLHSKQNYTPVRSTEYYYYKGKYSRQNLFCGASLILNNDSTFLDEGGCEANEFITIGKWKRVNDSIELTASKNTQLSLVANVENSKSHNGLWTTIIFIDKTGEAIRRCIVFPINNKVKYCITSNPEIILDANDKRIFCPTSNDSGIVFLEKSKFDTLAFPQLEVITGKRFRFPNNDLPDTIKIYLNINKEALLYPTVKYRVWEQPIKFKVRKKGFANAASILKEVHN